VGQPQPSKERPLPGLPRWVTLTYLLLAATGVVATEFVFRQLAGHGSITAGRLAAAWVFVVLSGLGFGLLLLRQFAAAQRSRRALDQTNEALRTMNEVMVLPLGPFDLNQLLEELLDRVGRALHSGYGTIYLIREDSGLTATAFLAAVSNRRPVGRSLAEAVARSQGTARTLESTDTGQDSVEPAFLAAVPLNSEGHLVGVMVVGSDRPRPYSDLDISVLEMVAERLAAAVERDQLVERERRSRLAAERARGLLAVLNQAADALAPAVESYADALRALVDHIVPSFADWFSVDLTDGPNGALREVAQGYVSPDLSAAHKRLRVDYPDWDEFLNEVMASGTAYLAYSETAGEPVAAGHPPMMVRLQATSYLVVPVRVRGLSYGALSFATLAERRGFRPSDIPPAEALAERVAVTIERVLTYGEAREAERSARRQAVHLRRLMQASLAVNSAPLSETDILSVVAEQSRLVTGASLGVVAVSDGQLSLRWACSPPSSAAEEDQPVASLHHLVTTTNRPVRWTPDDSAPARDGNGHPEAWMGAPLTTASGDNQGSVVVTRLGAPFGADEESVLISVAQLASVTLDKVRLYREVQEGRGRLAVLIDSSPVAIVELTLEGEPVRWNRTARDLFGWPDEPPVPAGSPGDGMQSLAELWERTAAGEPVATTDGTIRRQDGPDIEVSVSTAPLRDSDGQVTGVLAVMENVSTRRRVEDQLNRSERMDAMGRLAGAVAHDFNNLLTVILGYNDLLARRLGATSPLQDDVAAVRGAAQRAAELTNQLLDIGRQQVATPQPVSIDRVLQAMDGVLRRLLGDGRGLELSVGAGVHVAIIDPTRLERVILNLVINAADAMDKEGSLHLSTETVEIGPDTPAIPPGRYVGLTVSDTGAGMDEFTLEHCFDPFFTTKDRTKGTGLGLAAVYGIVTQSDGHITVESEVGMGTTFRILLPSAAESIGDAKAPARPPAQVAGQERVLLVEDRDDVRRLAEDELTRNGYDVVAVPDGPGAVFSAEEEGPFDLLVTDVVMPGMSGPELVRRLEPMSMPVLYISGHVDAAQRRDLSPEADLLPKPFTPQALVERVRQALDRAARGSTH